MDETRFWKLIEDSWNAVDGEWSRRSKLAKGKLLEDDGQELAELAECDVIEALKASLDLLNQDELRQFDSILERKLYDIDRAEVQEYTEGSDDGFLYARGFIVIAGKQYYDAVNSAPSVAMMNLACEEMCYVSFHLYQEKFGEMPDSPISRESCQNKSGWPNL